MRAVIFFRDQFQALKSLAVILQYLRLAKPQPLLNVWEFPLLWLCGHKLDLYLYKMQSSYIPTLWCSFFLKKWKYHPFFKSLWGLKKPIVNPLFFYSWKRSHSEVKFFSVNKPLHQVYLQWYVHKYRCKVILTSIGYVDIHYSRLPKL